ncbi:MAG: replication-associated recombination protein A [Chloroflexota bacterium]
MTLWAAPTGEEVEKRMPLAARMRPRTLEEFAGQTHLLAPHSALRRSIEVDRAPSMILWGPPGSGKTTLAGIIADQTHARFTALSAVSSGVGDLRKAVEAAQKVAQFNGQRSILFVDEIHRFNKAQQDAILPYVEDGTLTLIGATTENPSFEVNSALLSRCRVFRLHALSLEEVAGVLDHALADAVRGLGGVSVLMDPGSLEQLSAMANGDVRIALTALEMAVNVAVVDEAGRRVVTQQVVQDVMQQSALLYDKGGAMHYDIISALIKSVRGSDCDASVYWLARMLQSGEDPMFVARRLILLASEDIGLADPNALSVAVSCQQAVHVIGMPEAYLPLAECTLYLARAPKSNSAYTAYGAALKDVEATLNAPVPLHLRNAVTGLDRAEGHGENYLYPHDFDGHRVEQAYLPRELTGRRYYFPSDMGKEGADAQRE